MHISWLIFRHHCAQEASQHHNGVRLIDLYIMTTDRQHIFAALTRLLGRQGRWSSDGHEQDGGDGVKAGKSASPAAVRAMCNLMLWPLLTRFEPLAAETRDLGMTEVFPSPSQKVFRFLFSAHPDFERFAQDQLSQSVVGLSGLTPLFSTINDSSTRHPPESSGKAGAGGRASETPAQAVLSNRLVSDWRPASSPTSEQRWPNAAAHNRSDGLEAASSARDSRAPPRDPEHHLIAVQLRLGGHFDYEDRDRPADPVFLKEADPR